MKLLIVNCLNLDEGMRAAEDSAEQLGILYLASSLRSVFNEDELEIKVVYGLPPWAIHEFKPDIVGLTSVSQNYHVAKKYARVCKSFGISVIIGGVHISTLPHTLTSSMDVGVINEGEYTIIDLVRAFMNDGEFNKENLSNIKGVIYRDGEKLVWTSPRERLQDLDKLPMPARELYHHPRRGIFTSRGCPYDCTFCFSKPFWGKKPRFFSADYVIKEMIDLVENYDIDQLAIYDDLFTASKPRFRKLAKLIVENGLHKKITFNCNLRPNEVDDEVAGLLKSMNVTHCFLGVESGNQRVLQYLKKQACTVEQNYKAIEILNKHGIVTYGGFIIGSPDETREEIMDTYNFIRSSSIDGFSPLMLTPLPGTPVWELAKKKGYVSDFMDWSILREEFNEVSERHVLMSETLSRKDLYALYMKFKKLQKRKLFFLGFKHPIFCLREFYRMVTRRSHYKKLLASKDAADTHEQDLFFSDAGGDINDDDGVNTQAGGNDDSQNNALNG